MENVDHASTMAAVTPPAMASAIPAPQPLAPVSVTERIQTLDVLRGFALLGIFMVNMQFFAMPFMKALFDPALATAPASEQTAWAIVKVFFEYKFVSLFSLLFGIGFSVQLLRARARQAPFIPVYLRRVAVLLVLGLAHALLLWYGDILAFYALISIGLLATFWMRAKALLLCAAGVFAFGVMLVVTLTTLQVAFDSSPQLLDPATESIEHAPASQGNATSTQSAALRRFRDLDPGQYDPSTSEWMEVETNAYKYGPFAEALMVRAVSYAMCFAFSLFGFGWHILAMFLLGAGLMKLDFFSKRYIGWHRLFVMALLPAGLLIEGLGAYMTSASGHSFGWHLVPGAALHEFGSVFTTLGYVGLWAVIVERGWLRWLTQALAATGRMALTNYLTQTVVATFLMYWWGLGWFGEISRMQQISIVLLVFPLQVLMSAVWTRVFIIGPMEWLWRSLTYLRVQPVRRRSSGLMTSPLS
jgi:uncharacterized protein